VIVSGAHPDKLYLRIGEAAELLDVRPSVLRFWEGQFPALMPKKSRTGQRLYNQQEIALLSEIRRLLYKEKLTIEGARKRLARWGRKQEPHEGPAVRDEDRQRVVREIQQELLEIKELLEE
jgi:DNA-binding transcriptional MerR regulator